MTTINQAPGLMGIAAGTDSVSRDRSTQVLPSSVEGNQSQFVGPDGSPRISEEGEIARPADENLKDSLKDYQQLKEALGEVEKAIGAARGRKVDSKEREQGLLRLAKNILSHPARFKIDSASLDRIRASLDTFEGIRTDLEGKLAKEEKPSAASSQRVELAVALLKRYAGPNVSEETLRDPAKARQVVGGLIKEKLEKVAELRKRIQSEIQRIQAQLKQGVLTAEAKAKLEGDLTQHLSQEKKLAEAESVLSESAVTVEGLVRDVETEEVGLNEGVFLQPEEDSSTGESKPSGTPVHTASVGRQGSAHGARLMGAQSYRGPEGGYEEGNSEYLEVASNAPSASSSDINAMDLSGNNLMVMQSSAAVKETLDKSHKLYQQVMLRLQSGDTRALELALILLSQQSSIGLIGIGTKLLKTLDGLNRSTDQVVKTLNSLDSKDPSFASKTAAANISANQLAADRTSTVELLRTVMTANEEIQNVTKSVLDVRDAQYRHLSRWNG